MSKFDVEHDAPKPERQKSRGVREWSMTDELTHDFANSEEFRAHCLERHGQYVTATGERITR